MDALTTALIVFAIGVLCLFLMGTALIHDETKEENVKGLPEKKQVERKGGKHESRRME